MKTKFMMAIPMMCLFLMSVKPFESKESYATQELKVLAVYDGNEGYGYNFIAKHEDDDSEFTMTFQKVEEKVMKEYDLDAELFLNQEFEVTYTVKTVVTKDDDGFDNEEDIYTITNLKAL